MDAFTVDLFCPCGEKHCRHKGVTPACITFDHHASLFCDEDFHLTLELYDWQPVAEIEAVFEICRRQGFYWQRVPSNSKLQEWIREKFFGDGKFGQNYHIRDCRYCPGCGFRTIHGLIIRSATGNLVQPTSTPMNALSRKRYLQPTDEKVEEIPSLRQRPNKRLRAAVPPTEEEDWEFLNDHDADNDWQVIEH